MRSFPSSRSGWWSRGLDHPADVYGHHHHFPDDSGAAGGKYLHLCRAADRGLGGAAAATLGCVICGIVISLLLYRFFQRHQGSACLFELLSGLKSASLGLIVSAAATILLLAFFGTSEVTPGAMVLDRAAGVIFLCALLAVRKWKLSPILVMLLSAAAGVIVYA